MIPLQGEQVKTLHLSLHSSSGSGTAVNQVAHVQIFVFIFISVTLTQSEKSFVIKYLSQDLLLPQFPSVERLAFILADCYGVYPCDLNVGLFCNVLPSLWDSHYIMELSFLPLPPAHIHALHLIHLLSIKRS